MRAQLRRLYAGASSHTAIGPVTNKWPQSIEQATKVDTTTARASKLDYEHEVARQVDVSDETGKSNFAALRYRERDFLYPSLNILRERTV